MNFPGFSLPDGAWIPPELIYLLPNISEARLKVLIVVLYHNLQVGGAEPLSLTDIEAMTGLARSSVSSALSSLMKDDYLERRQVGWVRRDGNHFQHSKDCTSGFAYWCVYDLNLFDGGVDLER